MAKIIKVDAEGVTLLLNTDELLLVETEIEASFVAECSNLDIETAFADRRYKESKKALREYEKALADLEPLDDIYRFFQAARCAADWHKKTGENQNNKAKGGTDGQ